MFPMPFRQVVLREDAWNQPPHGTLLLRALRRSDKTQWYEVRRENREWLQPWEATIPLGLDDASGLAQTYEDYVRSLSKSARSGDSYMWGMFLDGAFVGQISLGSVSLGSLRGATIGYWVSSAVAGRGVTPTAVAMVMDYAFLEMRLHRIEINIRPENSASLRVAEKLGLRREGLRKQYLHINGHWADHVSFAITEDEVGAGIMNRWRDSL